MLLTVCQVSWHWVPCRQQCQIVDVLLGRQHQILPHQYLPSLSVHCVVFSQLLPENKQPRLSVSGLFSAWELEQKWLELEYTIWQTIDDRFHKNENWTKTTKNTPKWVRSRMKIESGTKIFWITEAYENVNNFKFSFLPTSSADVTMWQLLFSQAYSLLCLAISATYDYT